MTSSYRILHQIPETKIRQGMIETDCGQIKTPAVVPLARRGLVSPLSSRELLRSGCQALGVDLLTLTVQPGQEVLRSAGTVASFLNWPGPVISFVQRFTVMKKVKKNAGELGVRYIEPYTNAHKRITGAKAWSLQKSAGTEIALPLFQEADYFAPVDDLQTALSLNLQWQQQGESDWGVLTGAGLHKLRLKSYTSLQTKSGFLITELPDDDAEWYRIVKATIDLLPEQKLRIVVANTNQQVGMALAAGVDLILTAVPIEMAHRGEAYSEQAILKFGHEEYQHSSLELTINDQQSVKFAYLHYLNHLQDPLGDHLLGLHNWAWLNKQVATCREVATSNDQLIERLEQLGTVLGIEHFD